MSWICCGRELLDHRRALQGGEQPRPVLEHADHALVVAAIGGPARGLDRGQVELERLALHAAQIAHDELPISASNDGHSR